MIKQTVWVRAEQGGFLGFGATPGTFVRKDDPIATNYSILGAESSILASPVSGIILGMTTMPAVKPGDPVYNIAILSEQTINKVQAKLNKSDGDLYTRLQEDLSTSITIDESLSDEK